MCDTSASRLPITFEAIHLNGDHGAFHIMAAGRHLVWKWLCIGL